MANFFEYNNVADSIYCLYKISESIKGGTAKEVWKTIYSLSEEKRFFCRDYEKGNEFKLTRVTEIDLQRRDDKKRVFSNYRD
jgi:hypothetical protein